MPSPLMRISLARPGACMAPKNIVFGPGRGRAPEPSLRGVEAASGIGLPQLPQKRWCAATSAAQVGQRRVADGAGWSGRVRATFSWAPQTWQAVALSAHRESQDSHTRPRVMAPIVAE